MRPRKPFLRCRTSPLEKKEDLGGPARNGELALCEERVGHTRLVDVRRSHRRTVLSKDAETNVSSIGDTCKETTLRIVNSTLKDSIRQSSPFLVPAEVL